MTGATDRTTRREALAAAMRFHEELRDMLRKVRERRERDDAMRGLELIGEALYWLPRG